jgi:hypothetical protein
MVLLVMVEKFLKMKVVLMLGSELSQLDALGMEPWTSMSCSAMSSPGFSREHVIEHLLHHCPCPSATPASIYRLEVSA